MTRIIGIGARLKEMRDALRMDQAKFAESIGISSRDTIYRWEKESGSPPANILYAINEKYGISVDWIVTGLGNMKGEPSAGSKLGTAPFWAFTEPKDQYMDFDIFAFLHSKPIETREFDQVEKQHWIDLHFLLYALIKKASKPELLFIQYVIKSWLELMESTEGD